MNNTTTATALIPAVVGDIYNQHHPNPQPFATQPHRNRETIIDPDDNIQQYWELAKHFWARLATQQPVGNFIYVERELVNDKEQTGSRQPDKDLRHIIKHLDQTTETAEIVDNALSNNPDWETIKTNPNVNPDTFTQHKHTTTFTITAHNTPQRRWSTQLGGEANPGETKRLITVTTNHANWRDRRNRRLTSIVIHSHETWPAPAH